MRVPRRLSVLAVAALIPTTLAACGSGHHGLADDTPNAVVNAATRAIEHVHTVRVTGTISDGDSSRAIHLALDLVNGRGATGTISEPGLRFRLLTVGAATYVKANSDFWQQSGDPSAAAALAGKWGRLSSGSTQFAAFASLTHVPRLLSTLLSGHGALTKGMTSTIDGEKVVSVRDASHQGTLYVAAKGPAYPVRIANTSTQGGVIDFSAFNAPVKLAAPASSVSVPG